MKLTQLNWRACDNVRYTILRYAVSSRNTVKEWYQNIFSEQFVNEIIEDFEYFNLSYQFHLIKYEVSSILKSNWTLLIQLESRVQVDDRLKII
jgi:hypothetical protein